MVLQSHRWLWEDHCYQGECGAAVDTSREYIRGGSRPENAFVKEGRDMVLENKLQHSGDERDQRRVIDCLSLGDDEE